MIKLISFLTVTLSAFSAFAIDTTQCPAQITLQATAYKIAQSSIYKKEAGWKEAQASLTANPHFGLVLALTSKNKASCVYQDDAGNQAVLHTASFQDPEEQDPSLTDQLALILKVDESTYVSYLSVKGYSAQGLVPTSNPISRRLKAKLYNAEYKRTYNIDLAMLAVTFN